MNPGLEQDTEDKVCEIALKKMGVVSIKLNLKGNNGWPDRLFFIPGGRPLLIEFKRVGEAPQPRQTYIHNVLRVLDYDIEVHDDEVSALQSIARALGAAELRQESGEIFASERIGGAVSRSGVGQDEYHPCCPEAPSEKEADRQGAGNRAAAGMPSSLAKGMSKVEGFQRTSYYCPPRSGKG